MMSTVTQRPSEKYVYLLGNVSQAAMKISIAGFMAWRIPGFMLSKYRKAVTPLHCLGF
jgi:hypothetical protein